MLETLKSPVHEDVDFISGLSEAIYQGMRHDTYNTEYSLNAFNTQKQGSVPGSYLWGSQSPVWGSGLSLPPLGAIHTSLPPLPISFTMAPSVRLFVA